jgi:hypothetical protein
MIFLNLAVFPGYVDARSASPKHYSASIFASTPIDDPDVVANIDVYGIVLRESGECLGVYLALDNGCRNPQRRRFIGDIFPLQLLFPIVDAHARSSNQQWRANNITFGSKTWMAVSGTAMTTGKGDWT